MATDSTNQKSSSLETTPDDSSTYSDVQPLNRTAPSSADVYLSSSPSAEQSFFPLLTSPSSNPLPESTSRETPTNAEILISDTYLQDHIQTNASATSTQMPVYESKTDIRVNSEADLVASTSAKIVTEESLITEMYGKNTQTSGHSIPDPRFQTTGQFDSLFETGSSSDVDSSVTTIPTGKVATSKLPPPEIASEILTSTDNFLPMTSSQVYPKGRETSSLSSASAHSDDDITKSNALNSPTPSPKISTNFAGLDSETDFTNQISLITRDNIEKSTGIDALKVRSPENNPVSSSQSPELWTDSSGVSTEIENNHTKGQKLVTKRESKITTVDFATQSVAFKDESIKISTVISNVKTGPVSKIQTDNFETTFGYTLNDDKRISTSTSSNIKTDPVSKSQPLTDNNFETTFGYTLNDKQSTFSSVNSNVETNPVSKFQPLTDNNETTFSYTLNDKQGTSTSAQFDNVDVGKITDPISEFTTNSIIRSSTNDSLSFDMFLNETLKKTKESFVTGKDDWIRTTHVTMNDLNSTPVITTWDTRSSFDYLPLEESSTSQPKETNKEVRETGNNLISSYTKTTAKYATNPTNKRTPVTKTEASLNSQPATVTQWNFENLATSEKSDILNSDKVYTTLSMTSKATPGSITEKTDSNSRHSASFTSGQIFSSNDDNLLMTVDVSSGSNIFSTNDVEQSTTKVGTEKEVTVSNPTVIPASKSDQSRIVTSVMSTIGVTKDDEALLTSLANHNNGDVSVPAKKKAVTISLSVTEMNGLMTKKGVIQPAINTSLEGSHTGEQIETVSTHASEETESDEKTTIQNNLVDTIMTSNTLLQNDWKTDNFKMLSDTDSQQTKSTKEGTVFWTTQAVRNTDILETPSPVLQTVSVTELESHNISGFPDVTEGLFSSRLPTETPLVPTIETKRTEKITKETLITSSLPNSSPKKISLENSTELLILTPSTEAATCCEDRVETASTINQEIQESSASATESRQEMQSSGLTLSYTSDKTVSSRLDESRTSGVVYSSSTNKRDDSVTKTTQSNNIPKAVNHSDEYIRLSSSPPSKTETPVTVLNTATALETLTENSVVVSTLAPGAKEENEVIIRSTDPSAKNLPAYETTINFLKQLSEHSTTTDTQSTSSARHDPLSSFNLQESISQTSLENVTSFTESLTQRNKKTTETTFPTSPIKSTSDERNTISELFTTESLAGTETKNQPISSSTIPNDFKTLPPELALKTSGTEKAMATQDAMIVTTQEKEKNYTNSVTIISKINMSTDDNEKQTTVSAEMNTSEAIENTTDEPSIIPRSITREPQTTGSDLADHVTKEVSGKLSSTVKISAPRESSTKSFDALQELTSTAIQSVTNHGISMTRSIPVTASIPVSNTVIGNSTPSEIRQKTNTPSVIPEPNNVSVTYVEFEGVIRITNGLKWSSSLARKNTEEFGQAEAYIRNMVCNLIILKYKTL